MGLKRSILLWIIVLAILATPSMAVERDKSENITTYDKGYRYDKDGWTYLHIEGGPYERGYQHGYLMAPEIGEIFRSLKYLTLQKTGMSWEFFVNSSEKMYPAHIDQEYMDEIRGIAAGTSARGINLTWQDILAWNVQYEMYYYWWPKIKESVVSEDKEHCTAFIATGSYTRSGKIVMAHSTTIGFETGQFFNLITDLVPDHGHRIFMQSSPGFISSLTDFFVTDAGIVGTETTIGYFNKYSENKTPEVIRGRKAMQYADTLDQWKSIMMDGNNGGIANNWLVGDINSGEIMQFELGLNYSNVTKTKDGHFLSFNEVTDPRIKNLECDPSLYLDIRGSMGARLVRLTQLMKENKGKIDVDVAKAVMADHYDVYLDKENPGSRTIDSHFELDREEYITSHNPPYLPAGTVDGKVIDSDLARNMSFWARFGNSAGMPFDAEAFLDEHIQYGYLRGYLKDRPAEPWVLFSANSTSAGSDGGTVRI